MLNKSGYREIPLAQLFESPHNPRRRFNEKTLAELAASIEEHGVLTPILVRSDDGGFEIAAGHRRFRAAKIAGFVTIPAIVREMTDRQFMEILTVENLQREDVHAYEESQGYAELLKLPGYDVAAVAGKIGRSENYVRSRLKLLNLTAEVADAFLSDRITFAHARLIAPLRAEKQTEALKACFERYSGKSQLLPPQDLREWISDGQGDDLSDAPFALDDAHLVPEAGSCLRCPKSTCGSGKLFADDTGDEVCYDTKCFELKIDVTIQRQTKAGLVAISTGWDAKKDPPGALVRKEYTRVEVPEAKAAEQDDRVEPMEGDDDENYEDELDPAEQPCDFIEEAVIVAGDERGETAKICRNPKCPVHGKEALEAAREARQSSSNTNGNSQHSERQREAKEEREKLEKEWERRREIYNEIRADWQPNLDPTLGLLLVMHRLKSIYSTARLKVLCEERELEAEPKTDLQVAALVVWAEKAGGYELAELLIDLLLEPQIERQSWATEYDLLTIASGELGIPEKKPEPVKKPATTKKAAKKKK